MREVGGSARLSLDDTQRIWIAVGVALMGVIFMFVGGSLRFQSGWQGLDFLYWLGIVFGISGLGFFFANLFSRPSFME